MVINLWVQHDVVAALFATLFGRRKGALAAAVGIGVSTVLVGANAAAVRAALMGGLSLFARQVGRRQHGVNSLVFVAALPALLLAAGGYAPINPPAWIDKLRPQVVLLSLAAGDRRGLPDAATMEAVRAYAVLRTDRNRWIEISTDGERMWVEVERR